MTAPAAVVGLIAAALAARRALACTRAAAARSLALSARPPTQLGGGPHPREARVRWSWPPAPPALAAALADAGLDVGVDRAWAAWLSGLVVAPMLAVVAAGPGAGVGAGVLLMAGPPASLRVMRGRGASKYEAALSPALEAVARSLRSGAGLRQALAEAGRGSPGRLGADIDRVVADTERGIGLAAALDGWVERRPERGVRLAVAALTLGLEAGGAQARAVDGVAATMRQRARAEAEAKALGAQARLSAMVIAAAPVAFAALAAVLDPRTAQFLFRTAAGAAMLAAGIVLDLLGALWMARLARVVRR